MMNERVVVEGGYGEEPALTPAQALQRASVVVITVGVLQLGGTVARYFVEADAGNDSAVNGGLSGWSLALMLTGLVYVLCGLPIRWRFKPAIWLGMTAALTQAGIFGIMAMLGLVAGMRAGDPGTATMGVLLFGTIASIHLFVLRWLWQAR